MDIATCLNLQPAHTNIDDHIVIIMIVIIAMMEMEINPCVGLALIPNTYNMSVSEGDDS